MLVSIYGSAWCATTHWFKIALVISTVLVLSCPRFEVNRHSATVLGDTLVNASNLHIEIRAVQMNVGEPRR